MHLGKELWGPRPSLGLRRLWALITGLPADSNTMEIIRRESEEAEVRERARNFQPAMKAMLLEDMSEEGAPGGTIVMGA